MEAPPKYSDDNTLALLGKKQVLKRRFGFWSLFGFAVCELITWETVLALFSQGFNNGGPAGLVYGFIIAWGSTLSVYTVISELASMAPIAAGQYVRILSPSYVWGGKFVLDHWAPRSGPIRIFHPRRIPETSPGFIQ